MNEKSSGNVVLDIEATGESTDSHLSPGTAKELIRAKALLFARSRIGETGFSEPAIRLLASIAITGKAQRNIVGYDHILYENAKKIGIPTEGNVSEEMRAVLTDLLLNGTEFKGSNNSSNMYRVNNTQYDIGKRIYNEVKAITEGNKVSRSI